MKAQSPLLGFNNNVRHKGRVFHIQTEDSGVRHPHIITHLFADGGRILKTTKTSYAEHVGETTLAETVRAMMQEQHKAMFIALRDGQFDGMFEDAGDAAKRAALDSQLDVRPEAAKIPPPAPSAPVLEAPLPPPSVTSVSPAVAPAPAPPPEPLAAVAQKGSSGPMIAVEVESIEEVEVDIEESPVPPKAAPPLPPNAKKPRKSTSRPRLVLDQQALVVQDGADREALARAKTAPPPPKSDRQAAKREPLDEASIDLDLDALERAAQEAQTPFYKPIQDLPPPPATVLGKKPAAAGAAATTTYSVTPVHGTRTPQPPPSSAGRYAPSRPAAIFATTRPPEGGSIFGEDLISEKSLDEVILSYLAEDLEGTEKK